MQILIKYKNTREIIEYINFVNDKYKQSNNINVEIDLSPLKI